MTAPETERLRAVEENQQATNEKLDYLIERFDKFVDNSEKRFITRVEGKAYAAAISLIFSIVIIWLQLKDHLK